MSSTNDTTLPEKRRSDPAKRSYGVRWILLHFVIACCCQLIALQNVSLIELHVLIEAPVGIMFLVGIPGSIIIPFVVLFCCARRHGPGWWPIVISALVLAIELTIALLHFRIMLEFVS